MRFALLVGAACASTREVFLADGWSSFGGAVESLVDGADLVCGVGFRRFGGSVEGAFDVAVVVVMGFVRLGRGVQRFFNGWVAL